MNCVLKKRIGERNCRKCRAICKDGDIIRSCSWNKFLRKVFHLPPNKNDARKRNYMEVFDEENPMDA